ncbi:hydantoinase [Thermodesulfomicrobium sp. WS]|uniref:hydantoinase/oxoprolinase family protein n=1 Tax=Thermodesulfomicrobium sp. WS TaxID=3004129 RepID=UPI0024925316|nr:hydantoinase/oxoprolinase family protein [Thermodesulfomicrobium sp. WS]BDV01537.1 hydantoinase [Thermodesulfomicrobium sp. WS]
MTHIIGIDTGGTSTDAALVDANGRVCATAKVPTRRAAVETSILAALETVRAALPDPQAELTIALSTTLATNALVEGRGAEVGLIVIGAPKALRLPAALVCHVPGGHKARGIEHEPLGLEVLLEGVTAMRGHVDAYAVAALLSFADPSHEEVAARAIALVDPKPVFCSHQASGRPGLKERAATALANAQLLPIMEGFVARMERVLPRQGGRVFLVRGDATAMDLAEARRHAAHTAASGPAATALWGAAMHRDAVVVDVGGTTTDIALVAEGRPVIAPQGLTMAGLSTHVPAVDTDTVGVGGDSLVEVCGETLAIGPQRVTPLCRVPALNLSLPHPRTWLGPGPGRLLVLPRSDHQLAQAPTTAKAATGTAVWRWLLARGPATWGELRRGLDVPEARLEAALAWLEAQGLVVITGLTPTDCLHAQGTLDLWDRGLAQAGVDILAQAQGLKASKLAQRILDTAASRITQAIVHALGMRHGGPALAAALNTHAGPYLELSVRLRLPLVGMGAAAPYLLPPVAKALGTELIIPAHAASGNAIGAALAALRQHQGEE